jgi:hypothetical protein
MKSKRARAWSALTLSLFLLSAGTTATIAKARQNPPKSTNESSAQTSTSSGAGKSLTESVDVTALPRTRISLMPFRHLALQYAVAGYLRSKVPLVACDGTKYLQAGFSDDPGIYYFIPRIAIWSGLPLESAIDLFFGGVLALSFLAGIIGFLIILNRWPLKLWSVFALCMLLWFAYRKGDVYVALSAPAVAIVPWFLYLLRKNAPGLGTAVFLFGVGLLAGFANQMRSYAATSLVIFIVIVVAFKLKTSHARKLILLAVLAAGMLLPAAYFRQLIAERDAYLAAAQPGYTSTVDQHPIWHTVYTGLGFTKNPYVAGYRDEVAAQAVYSISPSTPYLSPEYERILRDESWRIARQHPLFIMVTLIAKLRIVLFLLLSWANAGLLAAAFYPKGRAMESAFWGALAFSSLFGIVAIPQVQYLLGFMAFATVYGIVSLDYALRLRHDGEVSHPVGFAGTKQHKNVWF